MTTAIMALYWFTAPAVLYSLGFFDATMAVTGAVCGSMAVLTHAYALR